MWEENSMDGWSIRKATLDDVPKLVEVETRNHLAPWTAEHFKSEIEKPYSQCLLLTDDETDEQIAAYIVFWFMYDECHILNVVVDEPFRRRGLAQSLVRQAVNAALLKQVKKVILDVRRGNQAAIQLYHSLNFTITHVRKQFYSDGEDAYQMILPLQDDGLKF